MSTKLNLSKGSASTSGAAPQPLVTVDNVSVHFALGSGALARLFGRSSGVVKALDEVSLEIAPGEVVGLVGESGSGKSTLGRALLGMAPVKSGAIRYRDRDITGLGESAMKPLRKKLQMVFQDPAAALNPTMTIFEAIEDGLIVHGVGAAERPARVHDAMERVGLAPVERFASKYPSELSGGQKQRAVIARSVALDPELIVADEPISMLDMSVRAKVLDLMSGLRDDKGISFLYITHDLASARFFCDRIAIMYLGRIVETGPVAEIFANPQHPYTRALLSAVPDVSKLGAPDDALPRGEIPDAARPPAGCAFHPRCPVAFAACGWEGRDLKVVLEERWVSLEVEEYQRELELFGDLGAVTTVGGVSRVSVKDSAAALTVLHAMRDAGEPFFAGVREMRAEGSHVVIEFVESSRPDLLPVSVVGTSGRADASGVRVACHLAQQGAG
ncbi:ABC transporter ATP-binding protein [Micrococcales bacterium 31B]|nr:ABC transporter ATP-binding protein [Micrococcales bacterium 31B]